MRDRSSGGRPGVPRDMPDQQAGSQESEEERQETPQTPDVPDVPGTDEPGSRPRGSHADEDETPTPEPHEPTD